MDVAFNMSDLNGRVLEQGKERQVVADVDVIVAGGGCSGVFAALAAAKAGSKTLMIERFGTLGGNAGPGLIFGCVSPILEGPAHLPDGNQSLAKLFEERLEELRGSIPASRLSYSSLFSFLAQTILKESGVQLMLSAWAADPILEDKKVTGIFVETKSGRVGVRCKVLIDATGEGDVASRAGAMMVRKCASDDQYAPAINERYDKTIRGVWNQDNWNEAGIVFLVTGIDWDAYQSFVANCEMIMPIGVAKPSLNDQPIPVRTRFPKPVYDRLAVAAESGGFQFCRELRPGIVMYWQYRMIRMGIETAESAVTVLGDFLCDDWADVSMLETEMRLLAWEATEFLRSSVPGFEKAWVLFQSPFLGARGGPHIVGDVTLNPMDILRGARYDDVISRAIFETAALKKDGRFPQAEAGYDLPYGFMLPAGLENILVTGRAGAYYRRGHDPATRGRVVQYRIGEIAGIAAAQAVHDEQLVRHIDITKLQKKLLKQGIFLGEPDRLDQLGLG